ncbi:MAG: hypothetical protein WKF80_11260, partial [Thermomicrobiales bacterium]
EENLDFVGVPEKELRDFMLVTLGQTPGLVSTKTSYLLDIAKWAYKIELFSQEERSELLSEMSDEAQLLQRQPDGRLDRDGLDLDAGHPIPVHACPLSGATSPWPARDRRPPRAAHAGGRLTYPARKG